jgi:hypothetical protein
LVSGKLRLGFSTADVKPYFHGRRFFFGDGFGFGTFLFYGNYT